MTVDSFNTRDYHIEHHAAFESQMHLRSSIRSITSESLLHSNRFCLRKRIFTFEGLLSDSARYHVGFTIEVIASLTEMIIFLYLGIYVSFNSSGVPQ